MPVSLRKLVFSAAAACFALALGAPPAMAATHHHRHHARTHHARHRVTSKSSAIVRIAQEHLSHLGYYAGKIDGVMGPKTRAAIRKFQKEHELKADGVLGPKTRRALEDADSKAINTASPPLTQENVANSGEVNQDFAASLNGGTKALTSRFGRIDVSESGAGANKRYNVTLNGQPILIADGQPSVVGVSPTYDLGTEDAIVFTTYSPNDSNCIYSNHVLALSGTGSKILDIENCTRDYQAQVVNGMLYLSFPERDDNRALGATWRLQGMDLDKL